jgi:hypothetical protein
VAFLEANDGRLYRIRLGHARLPDENQQPPIFAGRMGLQIACLFAVIINHRSTNSGVGRGDVFCLLDTLHLIIYALIFAAIFITLRWRMLNDRGAEKQAIRWERRMTLVLAALFAAANLLFIPAAIFTPPIKTTFPTHPA